MKQLKLRLISEDDYNKIAVRKQPSEVKMDDMQVRVSIEIDATGIPQLKDYHTSVSHRIQLSDDVDKYVESLIDKAMDNIQDIYYQRYEYFVNELQNSQMIIIEKENLLTEYKNLIKNMSLYKLIIHWLSLRK